MNSGRRFIASRNSRTLIRKALANNYDVRIAARRILEQQAQVRITRSQQFPSITVGGTGYRRHLAFFPRNADSQSAGRRIVQRFGRVDA